MKHEGIFLTGIGTHIPQVFPANEAVLSGRYSAEEHRKNGILGTPIAEEDETPPQMAVQAAGKALASAGVAPHDLDLLVYGYQWDPQHVSPSSYVHQHVGARPGTINLEVRQGCSAGVAMLELGARYLQGPGSLDTALITNGDKFCLPAWDRYRTEEGYIWGDAASAIVLSKEEGFARLLSTGFCAMSETEEITRGSIIGEAYRGALPLKLRQRKQEVYKKIGPENFRSSFQEAICQAADQALDDAGISREQVTRFLVPNMGLQWRTWALLEPIGTDESKTTWADHGRHIGHTGLADQALALDFLLDGGEVHTGDRLLLVAVGAGFTFSAAVVEIA